MNRPAPLAIISSSVVVLGIAFMAHESAHVLAGWLVGGTPTLLTATETRGDFDALSRAGFAILGASGSAANLLLAALGWWGLRRGSATVEAGLAWWFCFAVNGMLLTTKMLGEAILGWGDWQTILGRLPASTALRALAAGIGVLGLVFVMRRAGSALAPLLLPGEPAGRLAEARRIVGIGAAAAAVLVLGAAVRNPTGTTRSVLLAVGAGLGAYLPMLGSARIAAASPASPGLPGAAPRWPLIGGAIVVTFLMWFVYGPGIPLGGVLQR